MTRKKRIAFDVTPLQNQSQFRGIGRVVSEILFRLLQNEDFLNRYEIILLKNPGRLPLEFSNCLTIEVKENQRSSKKIDKLLTENNIDIYHCNENLISEKNSFRKNITIFYDIIPYFFLRQDILSMEKKSLIKRKFFKSNKLNLIIKIIVKFLPFFLTSRLLYWLNFFLYIKRVNGIVKNSDCLLHISENTKNDLTNFFPKSKEKHNGVMYLGIDHVFSRQSENLKEIDSNMFLNNFNIKRKQYFCYVGGYDYRKNVIDLLYSYSIYLKECTKQNLRPLKLLLVGKTREHEKIKLLKTIKEFEISDSVFFSEYVSDKQRDVLTRDSVCFLFPSLYEGFGIPVLEAMFMKIPVIAYRNSCLEEIVGESALLIRSGDNIAFGEAMLKIAREKKTRSELAQKGFRQSVKFSWDNSCKTLIQKYDEL